MSIKYMTKRMHRCMATMIRLSYERLNKESLNKHKNIALDNRWFVGSVI